MLYIKSDLSVLKYLSLISQVGLMMAIPIIGCILFGTYLDHLLRTQVLFLIIFTILGTLAAFRNLYKLSQRDDLIGKKDKNDQTK